MSYYRNGVNASWSRFFVFQCLQLLKPNDVFFSSFTNKDIHLLLSQVHESHLKESWQKDTSDKEKAMLAKQKQLEDSWKFQEILEDKDKTIKQLEENLEKAIHDAASKGVHMKHLSDYLDGMKKKHQADLKV